MQIVASSWDKLPPVARTGTDRLPAFGP